MAELEAPPRADVPSSTDRVEDPREGMRRGWVVWFAYAATARHLIRLATPAALVFVPLGLLALLGLAPVVDGSAALVNGSFELFDPPVGPLLAWTAAATALVLAAQAVVLPATVVLAAGLLTGRRVRVPDAMRAAARRLPAMLALALLAVLVCAVIAAAGIGVLLWHGPLPGAFFVMGLLLLIAMPCLLGMAAVVLEGRSPGSAIARGYRLACAAGPAQSGFWSSSFTLALGVLALPVAARQAVEWAASGHPLVGGVATSVLGLAFPAFQATVIARLYLRRLALRGTATEFDGLVERLPESEPSPARPVPVLAALLLPGLLYGGTMLVNPFGWLEVDQTVVTASWTRREPPIRKDGRPAPTLGTRDLRAVFAGQGSSMVMLMDGFDQAKLLTCADSACAHYRYAWAEPAQADEDPRSAGTRLPDGRIVLTTWTPQGKDETWRARLGLLMCDAKGCLPAAGGRSLGEVKDENRLVALAPSHYGGLMIAQVRRNGDGEILSVTTREDPACTKPRTKDLAKLPSRTSRYQDQGLAVAAGPLDRPVVLCFDDYTGSLAVITCEDDTCDPVHVEHPVQGGFTWASGKNDGPTGATMALREDGRPLIAYRDSADGSVRLLDCRNPSCSQADTVVLSTPGDDHLPPALAVDETGRTVVAYQDLDRDQIVVATCRGTRCTHTPVAKSEHTPGPGLAMALDGRGRPVIAWIDDSYSFDLVVTNPLNLPSP
ncbi:hypothetical protein [Nonomuraea sp. NPDC049607]|uniref:hypothetical protein n=1 Tax=Nonomuraea sp. NPDC049607 TaxID=3154732 RepID=UPI003416284F